MCGLVTRPHFHFGLMWAAEDCAKFDECMGPLVAKYLGISQGCGCPDEDVAEDRGQNR